jgi:hypothetical protein
MRPCEFFAALDGWLEVHGGKQQPNRLSKKAVAEIKANADKLIAKEDPKVREAALAAMIAGKTTKKDSRRARTR